MLRLTVLPSPLTVRVTPLARSNALPRLVVLKKPKPPEAEASTLSVPQVWLLPRVMSILPPLALPLVAFPLPPAPCALRFTETKSRVPNPLAVLPSDNDTVPPVPAPPPLVGVALLPLPAKPLAEAVRPELRIVPPAWAPIVIDPPVPSPPWLVPSCP